MAEGFGLEPCPPRVCRADVSTPAVTHEWMSVYRAASELERICPDVDQGEIEQLLCIGVPMIAKNYLYVPANVADHWAAAQCFPMEYWPPQVLGTF